jgi:putative transposase
VTETILLVPEHIDTRELAQPLVGRVRVEGVDLVGLGGPLTGLTKTVLEDHAGSGDGCSRQRHRRT